MSEVMETHLRSDSRSRAPFLAPLRVISLGVHGSISSIKDEACCPCDIVSSPPERERLEESNDKAD